MRTTIYSEGVMEMNLLRDCVCMFVFVCVSVCECEHVCVFVCVCLFLCV